MIILTIRSDKPEAEIGLYDNDQKLAYEVWTAHRQLAETIHQKIETLLKSTDQDWQTIGGIVCFKGPGSFTGLRIGLTVANALAASLSAKIVSTEGENWLEQGLARLAKGENEKITLPEYGGEVFTTKPRK